MLLKLFKQQTSNLCGLISYWDATPESLLNLVWLMLTLHLGLCGTDERHKLNYGDLKSKEPLMERGIRMTYENMNWCYLRYQNISSQNVEHT